MRLKPRVLPLMLAAFTLAAAAPTARAQTPAIRCDSTVHAGAFRLSLTGPRGEAREALLVLERLDACFAATLVIDGAVPAALDSVMVAQGVLTARVRTEAGEARFTLRLDDSVPLTGAIADRRMTWQIRGR